MTDGGAAFQPGADEAGAPVRPRSDYAGYRAFGSGDGAVLIAPPVTHDLRSAAKLATAEGRIAGGLLYGCGWTDELGTYLVIDHYLEADPWASGAGPVSGGDDDGSLSAAHLRLLREDAASMDSGSLEAGWWRTCAALGEFGPRDFVTQGELVGPDGVGLLVYGSGSYWGTAYLGPDGHAPDSAGTLAVVADPVAGPDTEPLPWPDPAAPEAGLAPEPGVMDTGTGESLAEEPPLTGTVPPRRRVRRRIAVSGYGPPRRRRARLADEDGPQPGPELPADEQLVVGALTVVTIAAAIIIGFIVSSLVVAVIVGAIGLLVIAGTVWMVRRY
jgi:hypothetical protein